MDDAINPPTADRLTHDIIGAGIEVHRLLGPGLLESTYERCLARELTLREHAVDRQVALPLHYKGVDIDEGYRIDLIVDRTVIVEVKAVESLHPVVSAQVLTYMKLTGLPRGLICNFHVPLFKDGIRRLVL